MPDNMTFTTIPVDIRTPGQFIEVDNSKAVRGLPSMNRRILFIGNMLAAGTAVPAKMYRINAASEAAALFGRGSVLHEMLTAARAANNLTDFWAIGLPDQGAGVAATTTVVFGGVTTGTGTIALHINGKKFALGWAGGPLTALNNQFISLINAWADGPVTASAVSPGTIKLTAKHKGAHTNDIDVRANYYPEDRLPAGMTVTVTPDGLGAINPAVTDALIGLGGESFYSVVTPWNDTQTLATLESELAMRWGGMDMRTSHAWAGLQGTHAALTTYGAARNSPHSTVIGAKAIPTPVYCVAAVLAAVCELSGAIDPARPFQTLPLPGVLPPDKADRFTRTERDLLLRDGISTFTVDQGGMVLIERVVTTYQVNAQGLDDVSYLDLETKWTVDYIRFAVRARIALRFPRHKLADDGTNFDPNQAIVTPNMIRGELLGLGRELERAGILEDFEGFKRGLVVQRSTEDRNRVNVVLAPNVVNQFRVFAGSVQFIL